MKFRHYSGTDDYRRISDFLITHYRPGNTDANWLEPMWEYMHFHPLLDASNLGRFGIWEESGEIIAICHYEWHLGDTFFQFHPHYRHLRMEMLDYAEANLIGKSLRDGRRYLCPYVNDNDAICLYGWNHLDNNTDNIADETIAYPLTHNGTATNSDVNQGGGGGGDTYAGYTNDTDNDPIDEDFNLSSSATLRRTAIMIPTS